MSSFAQRLNEAMEAKGIKAVELSEMTGISAPLISRYRNGKHEAKQTGVFHLAKALGVPPAWLMGLDVPVENEYSFGNVVPVPDMNKIPLVGQIARGTPILAEQNIEREVDIPSGIRADFALTCKGDSMIEARIADGDIVYIRQKPEVENGQIAAVLVGEEATLKRVFVHEDVLQLVPCNSKYQPTVYIRKQLRDVRILGLAVGFTSSL